MNKSRFPLLAAAMALALICGPFLPGTDRTAAAQKQIPQECVDMCLIPYRECIAQGEKESRCISIYRSCIARCK